MSLQDKRTEFSRSVWNHAEDPFQLQFDVRRKLAPDELRVLHAVAADVKATDDDSALADLLKLHLQQFGPELMGLLLQLTGLTRSKILSDLKSLGRAAPSDYRRLHLVESWDKSGPYLAANVRRVFQHIPAPEPAPPPQDNAPVPEEEVFEAVNQATYPGFIRQERAKRQGHQAEYRLAVLLKNLAIPFVPEAKADNPLCPDQKIYGESFDIVVPDAANPLMVVKSTVHTANIGQYGESKDDLEMREAQEMLKRFAPESRPILLALIDGVGFGSNSAGLNGVLETADEFCQFSTLWKAAVVAADRTGRKTMLYAPADYLSDFQPFLSRYSSVTVSKEMLEDGVEAGRCYLTIAK